MPWHSNLPQIEMFQCMWEPELTKLMGQLTTHSTAEKQSVETITPLLSSQASSCSKNIKLLDTVT